MHKKTALVVSYGPVPTPEYQKIEGGGMRAWGLATGLYVGGYDVSVAINEGFPQSINIHEGIKLKNWTLDQHFIELMNSVDVVVVSYCMGDPSVFVVNNIRDDVTLVLDAYVPIFIEVSARGSEDIQTELENYEADLSKFNHVLRRGDYFLCANEPQKHLYSGVLSSLGIINPATYGEHRIIEVPFGIESKKISKLSDSKNPYLNLGIKKDDFILLWFGGLYPWFDFTILLDAVNNLSSHTRFKFVLVGGKNPFNANPDFVKQYEVVKKYFSKHELIGKSVFMVDWVDYEERILWYQGADAVVSINRPGEENTYSWRTRVMDYVWGSVPMITNGGDPLSDELIRSQAAIKINTDSSSIEDSINNLLRETAKLSGIKHELIELRKKYYWNKVVEALVSSIANDPLPYSNFKTKRLSWGFTEKSTGLSKSAKIKNKSRDYIQRAREKGVKRSVKFGIKVVSNLLLSKTKSLKPSDSGPKVVLLSHPIDETGAPLVFLDIAYDFAEHISPKKINIVSPDIKKHLLQGLVSRGFRIHKMADGLGHRFVQAQLGIKPDDFVLMNSVALYENYRTYIYWLLETGKLKHANWFIHEDDPRQRFTNKHETARVIKLVGKGVLQIYVPSVQTAKDYNSFFETDSVIPVKLKVKVPEEYVQPKEPKDFNQLSFVTSGSPWDGRKGQFLVLNALLYFEQKLKKPGQTYRPYSIHFLAIGDDYISNQLNAIGKAFFKDDYHFYKKVAREKALEITSRCNITICSSLNETFALFVAEGMAMGHPIIRNKTSGWNEQIFDNKNGYVFDALDLESLAIKIEKMLDISQSSNEHLLKMSRESQNVAKTFSQSNYYSQLYSDK